MYVHYFWLDTSQRKHSTLITLSFLVLPKPQYEFPIGSMSTVTISITRPFKLTTKNSSTRQQHQLELGRKYADPLGTQKKQR